MKVIKIESADIVAKVTKQKVCSLQKINKVGDFVSSPGGITGSRFSVLPETAEKIGTVILRDWAVT